MDKSEGRNPLRGGFCVNLGKFMKKYYLACLVSLKEDTVYPLSILTWRIRNILRLFVVYALWSGIASETQSFLGYSSSAIISYVLLTLIVQAVVFSSRTIDVTEMISSGDLSNFLLKPINLFRYFFALDLGNKTLNLVFSLFEFWFFLIFFKPTLLGPASLPHLFLFLLSLILALLIYYFINLALGFIAFFAPENTWAPRFLFFMTVGFLAGELFPLDLLPPILFRFLMLTPFPYLIYFPIAVYLGKIDLGSLTTYSLVIIVWLFLLRFLTVWLWQRGLKANEAWGR